LACPGKSAFINFTRILLKLPLKIDVNIFTNKIKQVQRTAREQSNNIRPTNHSGISADSNTNSPMEYFKMIFTSIHNFNFLITFFNLGIK
jgi:hypothetical protein